ncbi:MAG: LD-carboxypeptidase [Thermoanaerobaculia bacterium]
MSSPSTEARILEAKRHLESRGLEVVLAPNLFERGPRSYLAGTDDERVSVANRFLRDPSFDLYLFARGGYGAMRILPEIDFEAIAENPRPIIGFSDLTALHQAVARESGVVTFHGPMLNLDFHDRLSQQREAWFWSMLHGEAPLEHRFESSQVVAEGSASAVLFGGCLSLTAALIGTPYDFWVDGGIWFWEEVDEPVYRIDRMLTHLRLSGRLSRLRGVVIGKLKDCGEADSGELDSLIAETFRNLGIPVVRDLPFGHHGDNLLLPVGVPAHLDTRQLTLSFTEPVVAPLVAE